MHGVFPTHDGASRERSCQQSRLGVDARTDCASRSRNSFVRDMDRQWPTAVNYQPWRLGSGTGRRQWKGLHCCLCGVCQSLSIAVTHWHERWCERTASAARNDTFLALASASTADTESWAGHFPAEPADWLRPTAQERFNDGAHPVPDRLFGCEDERRA